MNCISNNNVFPNPLSSVVITIVTDDEDKITFGDLKMYLGTVISKVSPEPCVQYTRIH